MNKILKDKVISLRKKGKTYSEICGLLGVKISKSKVVGVVKTRNFEESDGKNFLEIFS